MGRASPAWVSSDAEDDIVGGSPRDPACRDTSPSKGLYVGGDVLQQKGFLWPIRTGLTLDNCHAPECLQSKIYGCLLW